MKRISLIAGIALIAGLSSCKKDYDCNCTILGVDSTTTIPDSKKGDAEDACDALATSGQLLDPDATCSLD